MTSIPRIENLLPAMGAEEAIAGGICYCDSPGVNLQVCLSHIQNPSIFCFYYKVISYYSSCFVVFYHLSRVVILLVSITIV